VHVRPLRRGQRVRLRAGEAGDTTLYPEGKEAALVETQRLRDRLGRLQEMLFAQRRHRLLLVLQGMDTSGKDGTIRRVFEGVNPQGVRVASFRQPSLDELDHDFLWRVHAKLPVRGEIVIFDRSHYEDVLIVRVHSLVPTAVWRARYEEINDFERMLTREGTTVIKFFLHITREEQARRLRERERSPLKRWKSSDADAREAERWPEYMEAYGEMLRRTGTPVAPWHVIPSNHKWFRDWLVSQVLVARLEELRLRYPAKARPEPGGTAAP
jgi:PPK2 family polyphosphate:nucleotide phosphotransferase